MLESELFRDRKYRVRLARSGRTMLFTPDVEEAVVCSDGSIDLPKLAGMVQFAGEVEDEAVVRGGSEIVAFLV